MKKTRSISIALALGIIPAIGSFAVTPHNFYITYVSQEDAKSLVKYGESQGVHQYFMWTIDQDAPLHSPFSLMNAAENAATQAGDPRYQFDAYYSNYATYNDQRAIPGKEYVIKNNADLTEKLSKTHSLIYAFAETQVLTGTVNDYTHTPHSFGALYLFDPWSDLAPNDPFCAKGTSEDGTPRDAKGYNLICGYAFDADTKHHDYDDTATYNSYGNFEAFADLKKQFPQLSLSLSIGGFGHNQTFEALFNPSNYGVTGISQRQAIQNFVDSVVLVMNHYGLDNIDIDYENVQMTHQQSQDYYTLLQALNDRLAPLGKTITLPIITNPAYISGTEAGNTIGFAPTVLQNIANLSQVKAIELMTYDFSGNFNYGGDNRTGFLTNVYLPNNYPSSDKNSYTFSVETATQAALQAGVPASKLSLGIASYGRALTNLPTPSTTDSTYLFSAIDANVIIPRGDQDNADCDQDISHWSHADACQGMFSYRYLMEKILPTGTLTATDHQDDSGNVYNGSTAFGTWSTPTPAAFSLTIVNHNAASGSVDITNGGNDFNTNGYLATGTYTYTAEKLSRIESQDGLTASFTYWKQKIQCQGTVTFDHNLTVTIDASLIPGCVIS